MEPKRQGIWIAVGVAALLCVVFAALACLPSWDGATKDSALWALIDLIGS